MVMLYCIKIKLQGATRQAAAGGAAAVLHTYFALAYFGPICPGMDQVMMSQHHRLVALYVG